MSPERGLTLAQLSRLGDAQGRLQTRVARGLADLLADCVVEVVGCLGAAVIAVRRQPGGEPQLRIVGSTRNLVPTEVEVELVATAASTGLARLLTDTWLSLPPDAHRMDDQRRSLVVVPVPGGDPPWVVLGWHDAPGQVTDVGLELTRQLAATVGIRRAAADEPPFQELFTALAETVDAAVSVTVGTEQRFTFANAAMLELLGERPQQLIGQRAVPRRWTWRTPEGEVVTESAGGDAVRTGQPVRNRIMHVTPAGVDPASPEGKAAERVLQVSSTPAGLDPASGERLVVTRIRDITVATEHSLANDDEQRLVTMEHVDGLAWWTYEPLNNSIVWSRGMYEIAWMDPHGPRIDRETYLTLVHPDDRWMFADPRAGEAAEVGTMSYRLFHTSGEVRYLTNWYRQFTSASGTIRIVGVTIDDSVRELALRSMTERRYQFERSFDGSPYGTLLVSLAPHARGQVMRINRCLADVLAIHHVIEGDQMSDVLIADTDEGPTPLHVSDLLKLARHGERSVFRLRRSDGTLVWTWVTAIAVEDVESDDPFLLVHVLDITSQQLQQEALETLARTDTLTGLPNRSVVTSLLDELCAGTGQVTVLMLDLDRFKSINDGHGHHVGDELLVSVAQRLRALVPTGALVGRLGGDEFTVVLANTPDGLTEQLAWRIVQEVGRPHDLPSGRRTVTGVSLGVAATGPSRGAAGSDSTRASLLRDADLAMYEAKENGGAQVVWCDERLRALSAQRHDVESRLRAGIEADHLAVYRQPIVRLDTFGLAGHEALVRLRDPEIGLMEPASFIPLAEQTGLIADVDHWVLGQVLRLASSDRRYLSNSKLYVAVNFSAQTLQRDDVVTRVRRALERTAFDPSRVVVEITESRLLIDDGPWMASLAQLRADHLRLAVDDFGTGYSGFSYLQQVRPDLLKIDRSFVAALDSNDRKPLSTIEAIVRMAHAHGVSVVAEGVETHAHALQLRAIGCDYAQGWLYGRPQPWSVV